MFLFGNPNPLSMNRDCSWPSKSCLSSQRAVPPFLKGNCPSIFSSFLSLLSLWRTIFYVERKAMLQWVLLGQSGNILGISALCAGWGPGQLGRCGGSVPRTALQSRLGEEAGKIFLSCWGVTVQGFCSAKKGWVTEGQHCFAVSWGAW